jgi:hypothetical protein
MLLYYKDFKLWKWMISNFKNIIWIQICFNVYPILKFKKKN